jgi:uncharacterized protein YycO
MHRALVGLVLLLAAAIVSSTPVLRHDVCSSAAGVYLSHAVRGQFGTGRATGGGNALDLSLLQPGDIMLGGKPGGAYGHFTHAGIYLGDGQMMEGYVDCGLSRQPASHYLGYDYACILRVRTSPQVRARAARWAQAREYQAFYPAAFKAGERYWNCTKLVWAAFRQQGVELDPRGDLWLTPDQLYHSPRVRVVASAGVMP